MKKIEGGVTAAKGYKASVAAAGIKYQNRTDMALVTSEVPAAVAGVFTTNVVKAAPVLWDQAIVKNHETAQAMVINSGIANACTGEEGRRINDAMAQVVAEELGYEKEAVLTASTGVIGMQIPLDRIQAGAKLLVPALSDSLKAGNAAAKAIMTTDTVCKECAVSFEIGGKTVTLGGMSKGSGMIHPNMATMICVLTTDVSIKKELLQELLSENVKESFNMISVDRDTSTNDTYVIFANGLADNPTITEKNEDYEKVKEALDYVSKTLARSMAKDGEGATKLIEATVLHANTKEEAVTLAKSVICSPLVKTAVYGCDSNWGRTLCALGYSGVSFDPEKVDLSLKSSAGELQIVKDGMDSGYSEDTATKILSEDEITFIIDMKQGNDTATAWGCDLTYDYVKINGDYRS